MSLVDPQEFYASNGKISFRTKFVEFGNNSPDAWVLREANKDRGIFLQDIFVSLTKDDPTELEFADYLCGSMTIWMAMRESEFVKPFYEHWLELTAIKRKADAFKTIILDAKNPDSRSSATSAKYIIEEPWLKGTKEVKQKSKETTKEAFQDSSLSHLKDLF